MATACLSLQCPSWLGWTQTFRGFIEWLQFLGATSPGNVSLFTEVQGKSALL